MRIFVAYPENDIIFARNSFCSAQHKNYKQIVPERQ